MDASENVKQTATSFLNDASQEDVISTYLDDSAPRFLQVIAPPGTGKTAIIARTIDRMYQRPLEQLILNPPQFLALTFTRRTREDLVQKLSLMPICRKHRRQILQRVRNFHSLSFCLLCWKGLLQQQQISKYMKNLIDCMPDVAEKSEMLERVKREGQMMLAEGLQEGEWKQECEKMIRKGDVQGKLLLLYWQYLQDKFKQNRETTFDHCLIKAAEAIRSPTVTCRHLDLDSILYLIVDEFQDCSPAQLKIVDALIQRRGGKLRVLMLGDIDQNIYSWRGASMAKFEEFSLKYSPKILTLSKNFRLGKETQAMSEKLIISSKDYAQTRSKYTLGQVTSCNTRSQKLELRRFDSEVSEVRWVVDRIYSLKQEGIPLSEMTILLRGFRCTTFFTRLKLELQRRVELLNLPEIPYDVQMAQDVMKTPTVKYLLALIAYFKKGSREKRDEEISLICSAIKEVGQKNSILDKMKKHNEIHRRYLQNGKGADNFQKFLLDFQTVEAIFKRDDVNVRQICYEVVEVLRNAVWGKIELKQDLIEEFLDTLEAYVDEIPHSKSKSHILQVISKIISNSSNRGQIEQMQSRDLLMRKRPNRLHIQTIHNAKGLEYRAVFLCSLNFAFTQKEFCKEAQPLLKGSGRNVSEQNEELRIIYTAITRSSQYLFISCSKKDHFKVGWGEQKHPQFDCITKMATFYDKQPFIESLDKPVRQYYLDYQRKKKEAASKSN